MIVDGVMKIGPGAPVQVAPAEAAAAKGPPQAPAGKLDKKLPEPAGRPRTEGK